MEKIFIVRTGVGHSSTPNGMEETTKIEFLVAEDWNVVREFFFVGMSDGEVDEVYPRIQRFLDGGVDAFQLAGTDKYAVRCEEQAYPLAQMLSIINTIVCSKAL